MREGDGWWTTRYGLTRPGLTGPRASLSVSDTGERGGEWRGLGGRAGTGYLQLESKLFHSC